MLRRAKRWRYGWIGLGLLGVIASLAFVFPQLSSASRRRHRVELEQLQTAPVRRADVWGAVTAGGVVGSTNQTDIACELQSLSAGVRGRGLMTNGASTILSVVPAGTMVKKDQILCELDSAPYIELVRQQEMTVERARADHLQAKLDYEVAEMAVDQYRKGILRQTQQSLDGQIAMVKSELERTTDRLNWSQRMYDKGYASLGQVSSDKLALQRLIFNFEQSQLASKVFNKYEVPGTLRQLDNRVRSTKSTFEYQTSRLERHESRLELFKQQVENCTIRAPHDGFLIYANDPWRNLIIEAGVEVRQKQTLFYLPDLANMEVKTLLHESIVKRVRDGMRTKIRVEGLRDHVIEGHVASIASLPSRNFFSEVTYYVGQIKLDNVPRGLLPGMTAEVEIATVHRPDALTIPVESMTIENGVEVCYVSDGQALQRREVKLGQASDSRLEVTEGLSEGEQVVLNPGSIDAELMAEFATLTPSSNTPDDPQEARLTEDAEATTTTQ